jgi:hypothetical protein
MLTRTRSTISAISVAAMLSASSLAAVPAAQAASPGAYNGTPIVQVGHKGGWSGKKWKKYSYKKKFRGYRHRHDNDFAIGILGFTAGVVLGSALAQPHYYGTNWHAYCEARFKTYKRSTRTYTGYDGLEHPCP